MDPTAYTVIKFRANCKDIHSSLIQIVCVFSFVFVWKSNGHEVVEASAGGGLMKLLRQTLREINFDVSYTAITL